MVRRSAVIVVFALLLATAMLAQTTTQKTPSKGGGLSGKCSGLHAGIRAQIIPPYTETPSVMLTFVLLNDSGMPLDVEAGSWRIVINGGERNDSGMIFGNGPEPEGGYKVLKAGESYEFGKALPIAEYFPPKGQYKVSWKGAAFQSPTINVTITPASH
jgi:hypothetical protein